MKFANIPHTCIDIVPNSKIINLCFTLTLLFVYIFPANAQREIILNTTGYGFDRTTANGIDPGQWDYIQKFAKLKSNGKDASVTAVRLHIQWQQYEPTLGSYQREKLVLAIQTILALNPNMKVALHFSFLRPGYWTDTYLSTTDIAQLSNGTFMREAISSTSPSIYSDYGTGRFLSAVDDALAQLQPYTSRILYAAMGNTSSEEFYVPIKSVNGVYYSGMYEAKSLQMWRNTFLPARYPNQSNVTWAKQTYVMNNAPQPTDGNYNSEMGRDMHAFAGWGLLKLFKGFYSTVKNRYPSLKVLHFISDFGSVQGNVWHLHNSTIPLALDLADGIYHTDGNDPSDLWKKIMGVDCIKGTYNNKIAAVEFDPTDLGKTNGVSGINGSLGTEWFARSFKHGAEYVHIAMHFDDNEMQQLAPAIASARAQYINPNYQPPARSAPIKVNIFSNVFTGQFLFDAWLSNGGQNFAQTDANPKSIQMTDLGYWGKVWDNSSYLPCNFSLQASTSTTKPVKGNPITLKVACSGAECNNAGFSWSGPGANNVSGTSVTIDAPPTQGNYTYVVTSQRSGCGPKSVSIALKIADALPVRLISFSAVKENTSVLLTWATSEEENSEKFEIERSADGRQWTTLGTVAASGETFETITHYDFTDSGPLAGQNLYRLKMIDHAIDHQHDQPFAYSRIVSLNFGGESRAMVYPNPATDKINITDSDWTNVKSVRIFNHSGDVIYESEHPNPEINTQNLVPGPYVMSLIRSNGALENVKFVKEGGR